MLTILALPVLALALPADPAENSQNYCIAFEDNFNGPLDNSQWRHDVTMGGGGNWEFEMYVNNRSNSYTENGVLYIMPTLTADIIGVDKVVNGGAIDLWADGCNSNGFFGCQRSSNGVNIINPIRSASIRTINTHSIKFGKVEVRARLPIGDWLWPAIWMLPKDQLYGTWPASGEIDIMESHGNAVGDGVGIDTVGSTLHWGTDYRNNRFNQTSTTYKLPSGTFNDDFHLFGLEWSPTSITTTVDGIPVLTVPLANFYQRGKFNSADNPWKSGSPSAPFDQEFYLIMNLAVGGISGFFPDAPNKPWKDTSGSSARDFWNAKDTWMQTWPNNNRRALAVDYVKMWSVC